MGGKKVFRVERQCVKRPDSLEARVLLKNREFPSMARSYMIGRRKRKKPSLMLLASQTFSLL